MSNERATIDDIIFCYRLFLRRHPDRAGFGAYADQVRRGARVIEIASSFLSSPEWLARRLFTAAPTAADTGLRSPPRLPAGWSEAELFDLITSIRVEGGSSEELKKYARADFKRFLYTLDLIPEGRRLIVLELGSNPYFTTTLIHTFRDVDLHLANFFGGVEREGVQNVTIQKTGEAIRYEYRQFNIEKESFPYEDESFDAVLFCEIIEHLLCDPVHSLVEIRRVLRPGGLLVLTTPNVTRLDAVYRIVAGDNIYDQYSGYDPYGRHHREYTPAEVRRLLHANGFEIETLFTADVEGRPATTSLDLGEIAPLLRRRQHDLGQYIFCRGRVSTGSKNLPAQRPDWLYRSLHG